MKKTTFCDAHHIASATAVLTSAGLKIPVRTGGQREGPVMTSAGRSCVAVLAVIGVIALTLGAAADPIGVALVESTSSNSLGVRPMDYVRAGQIIRLGPHDTIVLRYMSSCLRETITGGTVTVGPDWSEVQSGEVQRLRGQCGAGKMVLTGTQSPIAGRTFRGPGH